MTTEAHPETCIKDHPMHCCHTAVTRHTIVERYGKPWLAYFPQCVDCGRKWIVTRLNVNRHGDIAW